LSHGKPLRGWFRFQLRRSWDKKRFDSKSIGTVGIFEHRLTHAALADNAANPGQGYIEPHRLGYLGRKKSKLHFAGATRLCAQGKSQDGSLGWMRLQVQVD
jgi:hypothetical protein